MPGLASDPGPGHHGRRADLRTDELAGRKVLALFDRAEARDFADVYDLLRAYDTETLLDLTSELDAGFSRTVFADMLRSVGRYEDSALTRGGADAEALRACFSSWAHELDMGAT